jgi:hypothetical protein
MKKVTTIIISLITITSSVIANNSNPGLNSTSVLAGSANNNNVVLNFSSSNNSRFEIERSFYSNNFTTIVNVSTALATGNNFRINDNAAELAGRKIAYYRVKQTDANGNVTYSNTTVVNLNAAVQTSSVKNNASISFTAAQNGNAVITIKSITGKIATVKNTIVNRGNNTVEIDNNNLSKGMYTAVISVNGIVIDTQKVIAE